MTLETLLVKNLPLIRSTLKQWDSVETRELLAKIEKIGAKPRRCDACKGRGHWRKRTCKDCAGKGYFL